MHGWQPLVDQAFHPVPMSAGSIRRPFSFDMAEVVSAFLKVTLLALREEGAHLSGKPIWDWGERFE
jgi:hypothetical protein